MSRQNESGYMLIGAIVAVVFIFVVGLSLITLANFSLKTSSTERDNQAVYYIAEAGLTYVANQFEKETLLTYEDEQVKTVDDFFQKLDDLTIYDEERYESFENVGNIEPYAFVKVEKLAENNQFKLISTGYLGDESRTVSRIVQLEWQDKYSEDFELPPFMVFSTGKIIIRSGTISGDLGSIDLEGGGIEIGWPTINGTIFVPTGRQDIVDAPEQYEVVIGEMDQVYQKLELPPFPEIPTFTCPEDETIFSLDGYNHHDVIKDCNLRINSWIINNINYDFILDRNMSFHEIVVNNNYTLRIDMQGEDREIVVDHLNITNGNVELLGTGTLTIYVTDRMTFGSGGFNDEGDLNRLNVFLQGTGDSNNRKTVTFGQNFQVNGSLFAEDADIHHGGGAGFSGNIFTGGNVHVAGGSSVESQLIFAPNGTVDFSGGAVFHGRIISEVTEITGGPHLTIGDPFVATGPISIEGLQKAYQDSGGSSGDPNEIETGNKPNFTYSKIREENN